MAKKTKAKTVLAIAGASLAPVMAVWIVFTGRELILPGSVLVGITLSVLIAAAAAWIFIKSIGYFLKEKGES